MIPIELSDQILKLIEPFLRQLNVELVELSLKQRGPTIAIEIFADKETGGITIEECSIINRRINEALETTNLIAQDYIVEVSSPGVDRPLKTRRDFERNIIRPAHFFLTQRLNEKMEHEGVINSVTDAGVTVQTHKNEIIIPLNIIDRATLII